MAAHGSGTPSKGVTPPLIRPVVSVPRTVVREKVCRLRNAGELKTSEDWGPKIASWWACAGKPRKSAAAAQQTSVDLGIVPPRLAEVGSGHADSPWRRAAAELHRRPVA